MALDPNDQPGQPVAKFESMLKTDDVYFFDADDFEDIIHHYLNHGKISLAKKAIKIGLTQHTASVELKLLYAEVLIFENKFDMAERLLNALQEIHKSQEEIYIQRANIFSKKDDHVAAIEMLEEALAITSESYDIYSLLGMEYLFLDDYQNAKANFMKCLSFDEHDYASLYNVIYCFEFLEDYDGAIQYLNAYLDRNPYCQVAWHQLGKQFYIKELYTDALGAFDFAIIADDSFIGAYFEKGKVLEKLGRYEEAIESYETTIKIEDPTSHAYLRIGKCYEKLKNTELAKFYYYQTVHEDPLLDKGWVAITDFYVSKKNYDKALSYINKAINIDGDNPGYWKKCAYIHMELGNLVEADYAFKKLVELGNYELETWVYWACVVGKNMEAEVALEILKQGKEFYPENALIDYLFAAIHLQRRDKTTAREYLIRAFREKPEEIEVLKLNFPTCYYSNWTQNILSEIKKASE